MWYNGVVKCILWGEELSEKNNYITLCVDGRYRKCYIERIITGYNEECELDIFKLKVIVDAIEYNVANSQMEFAILALQNTFPNHIKIACCQSCRHGNFCPFGDQENKISCLIDYTPKDKSDVVDIFISNFDNENGIPHLPSHELLHWCDKYDKINKDNYYTYNDWEWHMKKQDDQKL